MQNMLLPALRGLSLQVTDACNLACSYCYFREKEPNSLSSDMIEKALNLLERESRPGEPWHVNLFGGEPTLFPRKLKAIVVQASERAKRQGNEISFSMTTNGTRFDDEMLALTRNYAISTQLSLDGNREAHDAFRVHHSGKGSFDDIVANLPRLKQAPGFSVRMTVSVRILPYLADSIEELVGLGINVIGTSPVAEDDWTEVDYEKFGEQWLRVAAFVLSHRLRGRRLNIKGLTAEQGVNSLCSPTREFGCGAATGFVFVDAKGDIYPCHRYPGYFNKSPRVRLGSVYTGLDVERRAYYVEANRSSAKQGCASYIHPERATGTCSQCAIQTTCGGACMAINENATGDPTRPPPVLGRIKQIMMAVQEQVDTYYESNTFKGASHGRRERTIQTGIA